MARANPHWRELAGQTALAVFTGPHAYISPTWYEAENVVPTWNYVAVHANGPVELVEDRDALLDILERSVAVYEAAMPSPWVLDTAGPFVGRLLGQIVGFRLDIERLEGKWKMSQNHPIVRREKVIRALEARGGEDAMAVARMVRNTLRSELEGPRQQTGSVRK
jgi:transcriptional regulator